MYSTKLRLTSLTLGLFLWGGIVRNDFALFEPDDHIHVLAVAWSSDGTQIAAVGMQPGTDRGVVSVLDATSGLTISDLETQHGGYTSVAWHPSGQLLAVGSYDQTVKIMQVESGEIVSTLEGHRGVINSVDWSADGSKILSSSPVDQQVILWDAISHQIIRIFEIGDPWSVAFSPDNQQIAVGGVAGLFIFPTDSTNEALSEYQRSKHYIGTLSWSHDGGQIAIGTQTFRSAITGNAGNPIINVISSHDGTVSVSFDIPQGEKIFALAWSPIGDRIATYSVDGLVRVWETSSGTLVNSFPGAPDVIHTALSFSPYGARLIYGGKAEVSNGFETIDQNLVGRGVHMVVPEVSLERLNIIAQNCISVVGQRSVMFASDASQLPDFVAQLDALSDEQIPAGCRVDLLAIVEAIGAQ